MKKKLTWMLMVLCLATSLSAISSFHAALAASSEIEEAESKDENSNQEGLVLEPEIAYDQLKDEDKSQLFSYWDGLQKTQKDFRLPESYSQIKVLNGHEDLISLLVDSSKESKLLYLGFEECPYCRAFLPKLNYLARSFDLPIYYYDVQIHAVDENFEQIIENLGIQTVPYAFKIDNGEVESKINHTSKMEEIESFLKSFQKNQD